MSDKAPHTHFNRTGFLSINRSAPITTSTAPPMPEPRLGSDASAMRERADAEAVERHRLRSNAFYQQESARRNATPSHQDHPAFRYQQENTPSVPKSSSSNDIRASQVTTLSSFINPGLDGTRSPSPKHVQQLKLVPEGQENAVPTVRGIIEDRSEHMAWTMSGKKDERTPVFVYSSNTNTALSTHGSNSSDASNVERTKSPKKKLLDRFNFSRSKSSTKDAITQPPTPREDIAPKAAALLGTSVRTSSGTNANGSRSSKKDQSMRSMVSSLNMSSVAAPVDPASALDNSSIHGTPISQKTTRKVDVNDLSGRRIVSEPKEFAEKVSVASALARSQSLHYYDKGAPPTPPTKDTPPEMKHKHPSLVDDDDTTDSNAKLYVKSPHHRRNHTIADETPSKRLVILHGDGNSTPNKNRGHTIRNFAHVVENNVSIEPSRATLVTDAIETNDAEEIREAERATYVKLGMREDGSLPVTTYSPSPPSYQVRPIYSPSVYQEEWESRSIVDGSVTPRATDGIDSGVKRNKTILQQHRHSSPVVDKFARTGSPHRKRHSNKSVSFEPRHTSHHYEIHRSSSADSQVTALYTTPCRTNKSKANTASQSAPLTRHSKSSSSSSSSLGFISTMMDSNRHISEEDKEREFKKLNKVFLRRPELVPSSYKIVESEPFGFASAVPSPLHFSSSVRHGTEEQRGLNNNGMPRATDELVVPERLASSSTLGVGDGTSTGSELSLRERFLAETKTSVTQPGIEGKLDKLLSLLAMMAETEMKKEEETEDLKERLDRLVNRAEEAVTNSRAIDVHFAELNDKSEQKYGALQKQLEEINYNLALSANATESYNTTVSSVVEEVGFLDEKTDALLNKVEAIEFQVSKFDGVATDIATMSGSFDWLENKISSLTNMAESGDSRLEFLEREMRTQTALLQRLTAVEQKVKLGDRVVSLGRRLAALEQANGVGGSASNGTIGAVGSHNGGIPGTGLWKRRAGSFGIGSVGVATPPTSAGSSIGSGHGAGGLWGSFEASASPPRR